MEDIKDIRKWVKGTLLLTIVLYLCVSFIALEFNPLHWIWYIRLPFVVVIIAVAIAVCPEVDENKVQEAAKIARIISEQARNKIADLFQEKVKNLKR